MELSHDAIRQGGPHTLMELDHLLHYTKKNPDTTESITFPQTRYAGEQCPTESTLGLHGK